MYKSTQELYAAKDAALAKNAEAPPEFVKPANEMAILRRVLKALEPLDWNAKLRVLDYVRSAAASSEVPGGLTSPAMGYTDVKNNWAPR